MNDASHPDQVTRRWKRALAGYAAAVATELATLRTQVIDFFVDVTEVPFWIDLAVVDPGGHLVEFYFSDDLGWMQSQGSRCGRLAPSSAPTPTEHATQIALPPSRVAAEIVTALAGHHWPADQSGTQSCHHTLDPAYLSALLGILERWGNRNARNNT